MRGLADQFEVAENKDVDSDGRETIYYELRYRTLHTWPNPLNDVLAQMAKQDDELKAWPWRAAIGAVVIMAIVGWFAFGRGRENPTVYPANCDTIAIGYVNHRREAPGEGAICSGGEDSPEQLQSIGGI